MKFEYYINENKVDKNLLLDGISEVYKYCMPFIKDVIKDGFNYSQKNDYLMYSGRNSVRPILYGQIRKNRRPVDTDIYTHLLFDRLFYEKFKIKGRSNSIFCTGSYITAGTYDEIYLIFPTNKYKILWSDEIKDLYKNPKIYRIILEYKTILTDKLQEINNNKKLTPVEMEKQKDKTIKEIKKQRDDELKKKIISTYHTDHIMKAIRSFNEIMVSGSGYIGLKYEIFDKYIKQYIQLYGTSQPTEERINNLIVF